jgi:hypothetical protein
VNLRSLVSIGNDLTAADSTMHETSIGLLAPCPEADAYVLHPPGMLAGQNQLSATVTHQGIAIAKAGHDCGVGIPHSVPEPMMAALHTATSSRKAMFSSSRVRIEGTQPAACALTASSPTPMLACANPVPLPVRGVYTSAGKNTVSFGMSWADVAAGWDRIVTECAIEVGADALGSALGLKGVLGKAAGPLLKAGLTNLKNQRDALYQLYMTDDPVHYEKSIPVPFLEEFGQVKHGLDRDADGNVSRFVEIQWAGKDTKYVLDDWEITEHVEERRWRNGGDEVEVDQDGRKVVYQSDGSENHGRVMHEETP